MQIVNASKPWGDLGFLPVLYKGVPTSPLSPVIHSIIFFREKKEMLILAVPRPIEDPTNR